MPLVGHAAAASQHPLTTQATGEVAGHLLEAGGPHPDLVAVFTTAAHAGALEDIAGTLQATLRPLAVVGCSADAVVGPDHELERGPAVVALAARVGPLQVVPIAIRGGGVDGWPEALPFALRTVLLLADPFSFPLDRFLQWMARRHPRVAVVGGLPAGARGPGGSRLLAGTSVHSTGAVAVLLGPSVAVSATSSHGARPVGPPMVVTGAHGNVITELAGRPALEQLAGVAGRHLPGPGAGAAGVLRTGSLRLGRVVVEGPGPPGAGDVLLRRVLGVDRRTGGIAVGDEIPLGTTVQFRLVDAAGAGEDLRRALAGHRAEAALLFRGAGRGSRLFPAPDHDVTAVHRALGPVPTAGCATVGECAPVAGGNARHTMTATVVMLAPPPGA